MGKDPTLQGQLFVNADAALDADDVVSVGEGVGDSAASEASHLGVDQVSEADEEDLSEESCSNRRRLLCGVAGCRSLE